MLVDNVQKRILAKPFWITLVYMSNLLLKFLYFYLLWTEVIQD